jgi:Xaa-Pro aminopeptidase
MDIARNKAKTASGDVRFCNPVSRGELERRWAAARAAMAAAGVDALIVQGANATAGGGYYRWFTGLSAGVGNPNTLIVPLDGLFTLVCHGDDGGERTLSGDDVEFQGIGRRLSVPNFPMASYLNALDPETVAREIVRGKYGKVGFVGGNNMNYGFGTRLRELVPSVVFVDLTSAIDLLKAIKSPEEIDFLRRTAAMQDEIMAKLCDYIRPGMRDFELGAYAQYLGQLMGSESGHFHVASAPADKPTVFKQRQQQGREIRSGDAILFQCENSGPAGYFVHVGRPYVLGRASSEFRMLFDAALAAEDYTVDLLKPGTEGRSIFAAYNAYMSERKLPVEKRLHCHAQGFDTVERPLARPEETMAVDVGMNIGIHPGFMVDGKFMTVCDNYIIEADGAVERLHKTPRQIFEL